MSPPPPQYQYHSSASPVQGQGPITELTVGFWGHRQPLGMFPQLFPQHLAQNRPGKGSRGSESHHMLSQPSPTPHPSHVCTRACTRVHTLTHTQTHTPPPPPPTENLYADQSSPEGLLPCPLALGVQVTSVSSGGLLGSRPSLVQELSPCSPATRLRTQDSSSQLLATPPFELLTLKSWESPLLPLSLSNPTSNLSANQIGSASRICPELDPCHIITLSGPPPSSPALPVSSLTCGFFSTQRPE